MDIARIAPPEPYRALIFDCDGTLADTMPNHYAAWDAVVQAAGGKFTEERFYQMAGMPNTAIIPALNRELGLTMDVAATQEAKESRYLALMHTIQEITAVADIARAHHGKIPMAVASGGGLRIVRRTLTATGLLPLFDVIVTADDVTHGKPAPDTFLLAAERLGIPPEDCIVYEDAEPGLEAARRAGMRSIDVRVLWR